MSVALSAMRGDCDVPTAWKEAGSTPLLRVRVGTNSVRSPHLLVGFDEKMIEAVDSNESEPRKFHVRHDV